MPATRRSKPFRAYKRNEAVWSEVNREATPTSDATETARTAEPRALDHVPLKMLGTATSSKLLRMLTAAFAETHL